MNFDLTGALQQIQRMGNTYRVVLFHDLTQETAGDRRRQREDWPAGGGRRA